VVDDVKHNQPRFGGARRHSDVKHSGKEAPFGARRHSDVKHSDGIVCISIFKLFCIQTIPKLALKNVERSRAGTSCSVLLGLSIF
jgi:hypothetical protein